MNLRVHALMKGGRIYTLKPLLRGTLPGFRFIGFCDGQRCGFFKTKKEFEAFVRSEPGAAPLGPHADATFRAEAFSTYEGKRLLQKLDERQKGA